MFPHLVNLTGLHLIKYQLTIARQLLGFPDPPSFVCEVVAPRKTLVREISCEQYQDNNLLPTRAVEAYIAKVEESLSGSRRCPKAVLLKNAGRF